MTLSDGLMLKIVECQLFLVMKQSIITLILRFPFYRFIHLIKCYFGSAAPRIPSFLLVLHEYFPRVVGRELYALYALFHTGSGPCLK